MTMPKVINGLKYLIEMRRICLDIKNVFNMIASDINKDSKTNIIDLVALKKKQQVFNGTFSDNGR